MARTLAGTFRSLRTYNYRTWAIGAFVSNVGTWMQRTAQDWIVLTQLSDRSASAVGLVMALQFAPQVLFLPLTGYVADHFDRRKVLWATQGTMGVLALLLGLLTVTGRVALWHVDVFAFLLGCATAFDAPARQTFVSQLVSDDDLPNAVGLNSTSFNAARMIGPAAAGVLIAALGSGWVFILNGLSFGAVLLSLGLLRLEDIHQERAKKGAGSLVQGFRYVAKHPDLRAAMTMLFLIGTFGLNFPIFISTMAVNVFHKGAGQFGVLTSMMAVGSVTGALLSAGRDKPRVGLLVVAAFVFGAGLALGALMPMFVLYGAALVVVGIAAQTFTTTCASVCQLSTEPTMRGRVMAIFMAIALGGTPIGAPIVGRIADSFGPRWGVAFGAAGGLAAAVVGVIYRIRAPRRSSSHAQAASPTTPDSKSAAPGYSDRDSASRA